MKTVRVNGNMLQEKESFTVVATIFRCKLSPCRTVGKSKNGGI